MSGEVILVAIKEERAWEKQPINALVPRRGMQTTDMDTKKAVNKALCSLTDRAIKEEHAWEKQPINALVPHRGVQTTDMDTKKAVNKALCSLTDRGNMIYAIPEDRHFDDEERDMLSVFPKVNLYRPYFPALHPTWKGGFVFYDTATAGKFYGDFQAQPPCRVHRKAYEFSQKLPPVLQVKLFPESHFWEDVCQNDCLDLHDIALYFFPSDNVERSRQNNSWLLDRMEFENSIMRSSFNGVELLILTSKQLHEDSKKITSMFIGECFLLGVFCPAKIDQALHSNQPSEVSPSECAHDYHTNRDEIKAVNMETDKKLDGNSRCISKELGSTIQPLLSEFKPQRPKDSTDFTMISKRIKTEVDSNLPPGFKKRLG